MEHLGRLVLTVGMTETARDQQLFLVLGGTGKTGRRVVERLTSCGAAVRVGSRSSEPAFDWEDPATWRPALAGVSAVFVSFFPDLAVPGAPEAIDAFSRLAVQSGVRRLVLLSGRWEEEAQRAEQVVTGAGVEWTIVRCSWFMQNFSESFLLDSILAGEVALPVDAVTDSFVDADDIADVAVEALAEDGHAGRVYELTGPRLLRFDEAVAEIAHASGRPISFVTVPLDAFAAGLAEAGLPADAVSLIGYLFGEVLDGRNAHTGDGVQRALGREARDFADYAREAAASGVWAR